SQVTRVVHKALHESYSLPNYNSRRRPTRKSSCPSCTPSSTAGGHKGQYISNKRPSRFVILSASEESLPGERFFASAQNDSLRTASADSQDVFFGEILR